MSDLKSIQQQVIGALEQATKALATLSSNQIDSTEFLQHVALFTKTLVVSFNFFFPLYKSIDLFEIRLLEIG